MIRLRKKDGTVEEQEATFVEVCTDAGEIAQLTYQDTEGVMHVITKNDPEAERYMQMFPDAKFANIVEL